MLDVYDLHLRSTSLSLPRRQSGERRRVSGNHPAIPSELSWASQDAASKVGGTEAPPDTPSV